MSFCTVKYNCLMGTKALILVHNHTVLNAIQGKINETRIFMLWSSSGASKLKLFEVLHPVREVYHMGLYNGWVGGSGSA